ncbi:kinase-like domain-containing protein [Aspergillus leporis]|uniref:Altered inheritance of mitochondria protein 9, mitochondrial n=1 Tax=Aspergillus leporis TaxID=41062 RepID=A0A5N5WKY2_9EURO|nr:kinase-like domain-containing protein [Aspergillus leporis]
MSKILGSFVEKAKAIKNAPTKFTSTALRIDAGHYDANTKRLNVALQVNSQAKSPVLKDWIKKNSTHENVATASYDTAATDKQADGRWLRRDKVERASRYISFNFEALCRKILELSPEASTITSCQKLEGGFNRVFIFELNNSKRIVARLPFSLAGPAQLTTSSEIATIRYLQTKTTIPIPRILDWCCDATSIDNSIGSEYIIMEHAAGVQLHKKWQEMAGDQRVRCIDAIYQKAKEVVDLQFPCFGSLYLADSPVSPDNKQTLDEEFCIGPHCGTRYWECGVGEDGYYHNTKPNRGPWNDLTNYCDGLIDAGLSRLPPMDSDMKSRPAYHGSTETHKILLSQARDVLNHMSGDPRIAASATPVLFHPDFHKRNIFVSDHDPSIITGIIDWQAASIEPAFWYSDEIPDFAMTVAPGDEICTKAFEVCSQFLTPTLSNPRLMDQNLFRPFRYSYRTWKDGAVALRHELIETARRWEILGFAGPCPFALPPSKELLNHQMEYRLFEAAQNLRCDLSNLLNTASDGWVPTEDWETTEAMHKEIFNGMLQAVLTSQGSDHDEPVKDEETLRSIWPFDI